MAIAPGASSFQKMTTLHTVWQSNVKGEPLHDLLARTPLEERCRVQNMAGWLNGCYAYLNGNVHREYHRILVRLGNLPHDEEDAAFTEAGKHSPLWRYLYVLHTEHSVHRLIWAALEPKK